MNAQARTAAALRSVSTRQPKGQGCFWLPSGMFLGKKGFAPLEDKTKSNFPLPVSLSVPSSQARTGTLYHTEPLVNRARDHYFTRAAVLYLSCNHRRNPISISFFCQPFHSVFRSSVSVPPRMESFCNGVLVPECGFKRLPKSVLRADLPMPAV